MSNNNGELPPKAGGSKVINVQSKDDINRIVNSQTGGQTPQQNQPSGDQQPPKQSGGGPEGQSQQNTQALSNAVSPPSNNTNSNVSPQANVNTTSNNNGDVGVGGNASNNVGGSDANTAVPDNDDIDIEGVINASEKESAEIDKDKKARQEKMELLTKAIEAVRGPKAFERILFNNVETGEVVGTKIRYIKDYDGKTAYDYMNDPVIQEHLEFVVPEDDPQDGSPVDRQISFFWKKPTF